MIVPSGFLSANVIAPIQYYHDISINVNTFIQLAICVECFFATFYPFPWETFTARPWVPVLTFIWPWLCSSLLYLVEQIRQCI